MQPKEETSLLFTIPQQASWHFESTLKPTGKITSNYVLIQPGSLDVAKVLNAYFHHPVQGYNIASIEILYNKSLNRLFFDHMKMMDARKGNKKYIPTWKTTVCGEEKRWREATQAQLEQLSAGYRDSEVPNVRLLPLWHGTDDSVADYIFTMGYGIFTTNNPDIVTDDGFFGKGVYAAHEAEYSFRSYAKKHGDKAVLLLNWVSTFEAYPVIDGDMDKLRGKMGGYDQCDAHFIPVRSNQHPHTNVYHPCKIDEVHQYTEMVVSTSAQCLPRYRVKLLRSAPQKSLDAPALDAYQAGLNDCVMGAYPSAMNAFELASQAGHPCAPIRLHWLCSVVSGVPPDATMVSTSTIALLKQQAHYQSNSDPEVQFNLGWCYQQGLGVSINLPKAAECYWLALMQGHCDASYQLGDCFEKGIGVKRDITQAIFCYQQAANQGHAQAKHRLSQHDFTLTADHQLTLVEPVTVNSIKVPVKIIAPMHSWVEPKILINSPLEVGLACIRNSQFVAAVVHLVAAVSEGDALALMLLSDLYADSGWVGPIDLMKKKAYQAQTATAILMIQQQALQGDANAQYVLGRCFEEGIGVERNIEAAFKCYSDAAEKHHILAQCQLGSFYENGEIKDEKNAFHYYHLSAQQGYGVAQSFLGVCYIDGVGVAKNAAKGLFWFQLAADQGYAPAQKNLAEMYEYGDGGVKKDSQIAVHYYKCAAKQGHMTSQYILGMFYAKGSNGVERNRMKAVEWYQLAASQGHLMAIEAAKAELAMIQQNLEDTALSHSAQVAHFRPVFAPVLPPRRTDVGAYQAEGSAQKTNNEHCVLQ